MFKNAVQQGRSEQLRFLKDGPDECPIARVQRGESATARCASTGDSPDYPISLLADFFSSLLVLVSIGAGSTMVNVSQ
ncbi:MAG: hypothetical protein E8D41_05635 [Nitrospira sp.]|nr:MAG: hypothetical protein E8D41_05635 [Nitrospira sp.]